MYQLSSSYLIVPSIQHLLFTCIYLISIISVPIMEGFSFEIHLVSPKPYTNILLLNQWWKSCNICWSSYFGSYFNLLQSHALSFDLILFKHLLYPPKTSLIHCPRVVVDAPLWLVSSLLLIFQGLATYLVLTDSLEFTLLMWSYHEIGIK